MATPTYIPLATVTLSSSALGVNFNAISQDYRDLVLVLEFLADDPGVGLEATSITINSDTGTNYYWVRAFGNGSTTGSSSSNTANIAIGANATDTEKGFQSFQFMDYSATDKHKSILMRSGRAGQVTDMSAIRWADTTAITSIQINAQIDQFAPNSTFTLYGIASEAA